MTLDVAGKQINFLVDTGATYSVLTDHVGPLTSKAYTITGVDG